MASGLCALLYSNICVHIAFPKTTVTLDQRSQGDPTASKKNGDRRDARSTIASNSAAQVDAVGSHRTLTDGAHFEHATNAVATPL